LQLYRLGFFPACAEDQWKGEQYSDTSEGLEFHIHLEFPLLLVALRRRNAIKAQVDLPGAIT
jgi:hypothetical protein